MKYIDADKLIAKIEKRQEARQDTRDSASWENEYWPESEFSTRDDEDDAIFSLITALQQEQPVDLEKEIEDYCGSYKDRPVPDFIEAVARHFYELGLKAGKK